MTSIRSTICRHRALLVALVTLGALVPAAGVVMATTEPPSDTAMTDSTGTAASDPVDLDTNGDGVVVIGLATPGPRDDGGYYQAMVDGVTQLSLDNGFAEPIIVDNVDPSQAETELRNLARQNVDIIAVGAGQLSEPLAALNGRGFIAIAAVIFGGWTLRGTVLGCVLFGFVEALTIAIPVQGYEIDPVVLEAAPYLVALAVMLLFATRVRQPRALGQPFIRGLT